MKKEMTENQKQIVALKKEVSDWIELKELAEEKKKKESVDRCIMAINQIESAIEKLNLVELEEKTNEKLENFCEVLKTIGVRGRLVVVLTINDDGYSHTGLTPARGRKPA